MPGDRDSSANKSRPLRAKVTVLTGADLARVIELSSDALIFGRGEGADVQIEDESLSREHARFSRIEGAWFVEDLGSTNGTFVDGIQVRARTKIEDGARVQLGDTITRFSFRNEREHESAQRLYDSMIRDPLTGAYNPHYLDEHLPREFSFAKRHGSPLSIVFVDVDHFSRLATIGGVGDRALRELGRHLRASVRAEDIVARYGGDEFLLVVRGVDGGRVLEMAERLRQDVQRLTADGKPLGVTVTVGVATMEVSASHDDVAELVARADAALYLGKRAGRNRVEVG